MLAGYSSERQTTGDALGVQSSRVARYYDRKGGQRCVECDVAIGPERQLCDRHLAAARKASAASMARARAERRAKGKCAEGCGRKSKTYRCTVCRPTLSSKSGGVNGGVYGGRPGHFHTEGQRQRPQQTWRTEYDGRRRKRNVGQGRRGAPSRAATDDWDAKQIADEDALARQDLAAYNSLENQALPPIQREALLRSALGHLELAERTRDDLVERLKRRLR